MNFYWKFRFLNTYITPFKLSRLLFFQLGYLWARIHQFKRIEQIHISVSRSIHMHTRFTQRASPKRFHKNMHRRKSSAELVKSFTNTSILYKISLLCLKEAFLNVLSIKSFQNRMQSFGRVLWMQLKISLN